jgi:phenylalanyl-tRNA synthetase beta chain
VRVPLSWLRDYVELTLAPAALAERLTLAGLEVTAVDVIGLPTPQGLPGKASERGPVWDPGKIVIGRIIAVERHPNADRLTLATVEYGASQPKTVVTGAPNIKPGDQGQKVILALAGSVLYDGHAEGKLLRELKPSKIRGVASDAMVCSAYELGISEEHEGIILLEEEAPVGVALADFMGDVVLEIDVLPNMARCLSMIGMAREVAAISGQTLRLPDRSHPKEGRPIEGKVKVEIADPKLSRRYAAGLITGVRIGAAPGWMQRRITYAGMRPVNNIVDITNYVMLEWGQPLHAFDYDSLVRRANGKAPVITVRPARVGEKITTLDGASRDLRAENLVIADEAGPVAIAGVMGGSETEVSATTSTILLESANFDFLNIRRTMKQFDLPSEASLRFSRGVHPEIVRPAVERAAGLMHDHAAGAVSPGLVDCYPAPLPPQVIELGMKQVKQVLGTPFSAEEATRILRSLEFDVKPSRADSLTVTVPPHRLDIQAGTVDLIEELARIHGYDRLPATLLAEQLPEQHRNRSLWLEEKVRDILASLGLQEVITYALTAPAQELPLGASNVPYVEIRNPISSERTVMRRTVLAGVLEVAAANLRHTDGVRFYEIGPVYIPRPGEKLPAEPRRLALVLAGGGGADFWKDAGIKAKQALDFFDMKGAIEGLVSDLHLADVAYRPLQAGHLHPGRAAEMLVDGRAAGYFGQMHPKTAETYGLGQQPVLVGELDLEAILDAIPERYTFTPISRFPAALRDIAVIVDENVPGERVTSEIKTAGGDLLRAIRLFDLYRGESISPGKKSLAYALSYQADDRTLTDKEVERAHKKIEDRLKHVLKAQIRGEEAVG